MSKSRGFTLIELMIVLAIIGAVVAMSMPYMTNRSSKTKAFLRQLTVLSRELHTRAKLQGTVYRLVIDMKAYDGGRERPQQTYWVEKSSGKTVLKPDEEEYALKLAAEKDDDKKKDTRGFEIDPTLTKEPTAVPDGIFFAQVELTRMKNPITSGKAYIHYLPEGLVDEAALHIKGDKNKAAWTISIHPLTGKAELITKEVSLQEMKSQ